MSKGNGIKTKVDVAKLEIRVNFAERAIEKIESNHLPHIQQAINDLDNKFETKTDILSNKVTKIMVVGTLLLLAAQIMIGIYFKQ